VCTGRHESAGSVTKVHADLDNGVADSPAHLTPAGEKMDYHDEAKAPHFPTYELSSFYDYFIGDAPSYILVSMRDV
jgi:hypothetical protein